MHTVFQYFIETMNAFPPELLLISMILISYGGILVFMRLFGILGLICFMTLCLVGANIQVLKVVQFSIFANPLALGTILFASTYLITDIITEHYGAAAARKAVWLGFFCLLVHNIFMLITLGYRPLDPSSDYANLDAALEMEAALTTVIQPQPGLLAAGLVAFLVSQLIDIRIFEWIKKLTGEKKLWLRNNVSAFFAAFIDSTIFSVLAWKVFSVNPVPFDALVFTYIFGTFYLRVFVALLDTPFMYLSGKVLKNKEQQQIF